MTHDYVPDGGGFKPPCAECGEAAFSPEHLDDESLRQEMEAAQAYFWALLDESARRVFRRSAALREGT